eukprot:403332038
MKISKILGVGTDIVEVSRMTNIIQKPSVNRFLQKVLNQVEIAEFNEKDDIALKSQYLASRWALKEAIVKASGKTSIFYPGIYLQKEQGLKPKVMIEGELNHRLLYEELKVQNIHSSISHEDKFAVAFVILETEEVLKPATRIDLKIEEDLAEYDEFKMMLSQKREQERLQTLGSGSAFRSHSPKGVMPGGGYDSSWFDNSNNNNNGQMPGYSNFHYAYGSVESGRQMAGAGQMGQQRKKKQNNITGGMNTHGYGNPGTHGMNDDSMNDSF